MKRAPRRARKVGRDYSVHNSYLTCECGKRGYHQRDEAKAARARLRREQDHTLGLALYRCAVSALWHVGHIPPAPNLNDPRLTFREDRTA